MIYIIGLNNFFFLLKCTGTRIKMQLQQAPKVKLSDGHEIPILGLGTWKVKKA